jgi:hypothetical protein
MANTANQQYEVQLKEVNDLARDLLFKVQKHSERFQKNDWNWSMVGDLQHVRQELMDLNSFFSRSQ